MRLRIIQFFSFLLVWLIMTSCGTAPVRKVVENKYISEVPPLEGEFQYEIRGVKEYGQDKQFLFYTSAVNPVYVEISRPHVYTGNIDYYYSLETIASNQHYYFMGPKYIDDHKWAKVTKVNDNGWLMCGYMTRKDHWFIFIHNSIRLDSDGMKRYEEYQKTLKPSDKDIAFLDQMFDDLNKSTVIIR